jgi:hypothetical protein
MQDVGNDVSKLGITTITIYLISTTFRVNCYYTNPEIPNAILNKLVNLT